jgi:hypothetical protein
MAPNFRRSRPIHSQTSNLPGSRRPRTSKPIRREFAQGIQVARLRPQNKEAGGGQGSGDGSGGRNPGDKVPGDRPPLSRRPAESPSDAKAVECARVPGASRRCGTQKLEPLKRPGRYHQETRGGGTGFRAAGWVGGREPRKQGRPPRPPRGSPADMPIGRQVAPIGPVSRWFPPGRGWRLADCYGDCYGDCYIGLPVRDGNRQGGRVC